MEESRQSLCGATHHQVSEHTRLLGQFVLYHPNLYGVYGFCERGFEIQPSRLLAAWIRSHY